MSQETTYGEYGEYQRDEVSEGSITPTRTPSASPSRQKGKERWKPEVKGKGVSQARAALSADVLDEEDREAEEEVNMPPIPASQEELIEQGLNINPAI